jgi:hypothetical protein
MGQYYKYVNLDKKEYLHPHRFGEGLKSGEWMYSGMMPRALAVLLIDGDGRGGGDLRIIEYAPDIIGRWAGDRIVISGDYSDHGKFIDSSHPPLDEIHDEVSESQIQEQNNLPNVYDLTHHESFKDISEMVILALSSPEAERIPFWPEGHGTCYVRDGKHEEQKRKQGYTYYRPAR